MADFHYYIPYEAYPESFRNFVGSGVIHSQFVNYLPLEIFIPAWNVVFRHVNTVMSRLGVIKLDNQLKRFGYNITLDPMNKEQLSYYLRDKHPEVRARITEEYIMASKCYNNLFFLVDITGGLIRQIYTPDYRYSLWIACCGDWHLGAGSHSNTIYPMPAETAFNKTLTLKEGTNGRH